MDRQTIVYFHFKTWGLYFSEVLQVKLPHPRQDRHPYGDPSPSFPYSLAFPELINELFTTQC